MKLRTVFVFLAVACVSASTLLPGVGAESGQSPRDRVESSNIPDSVRSLSERYVEFDNPVGTHDILHLDERFDEEIAGVRLVGNMSGEFIFGYRDTLEGDLRAVDESVARNFGVAPTIGAVLLKTPPSQEFSSALRRASEIVRPSGDGLLTDDEVRSWYSPKGLPPGIERLVREAPQGSKAGTERPHNVDADAWPGAMEVHAISGESDAGDEIWPHMTVWGGWYSRFPNTSFEASSPNNIPGDYGIELDFFLYNDEIDPGTIGRPQCDEENDERFWANKVPDAIADELWGPLSWISNAPSATVPYFDWADAFDGCDSRNFSNGIVFPQELPKNIDLDIIAGWNYWFEMTSVPGTEDSSVISLSAQTVYDNCKDMSDFEHYPPEGVSYCMGLTREEHSASESYIGRTTHGETAPACMQSFKWSDDVHRTEVGEFFDPGFPDLGSCAIG